MLNATTFEAVDPFAATFGSFRGPKLSIDLTAAAPTSAARARARTLSGDVADGNERSMNEVLEEIKEASKGQVTLLTGLQKDLATRLTQEIMDRQEQLRLHTYGALGLDATKGMQAMIERDKESGDYIVHLVSAQQRQRLSGDLTKQMSHYFSSSYASHSFPSVELDDIHTTCHKSLWENAYLIGDQDSWNDSDNFVRCADCEKAQPGKMPALHTPKKYENTLFNALSKHMNELLCDTTSETELAVLRAKAERAYQPLFIDMLIVDDKGREDMLRHLLGAHEYKKFSVKMDERNKGQVLYRDHSYSYQQTSLSPIGRWMSPSDWRRHLTDYMPMSTSRGVNQSLVAFQQMTVNHFNNWIG